MLIQKIALAIRYWLLNRDIVLDRKGFCPEAHTRDGCNGHVDCSRFLATAKIKLTEPWSQDLPASGLPCYVEFPSYCK